MGVKGIKLTGRKGATVVAARMVELDDEIILVSSKGTLIRMAVRDISAQGRDASGVRVMNVERRRDRGRRRPGVHRRPRTTAPPSPSRRSDPAGRRRPDEAPAAE